MGFHKLFLFFGLVWLPAGCGVQAPAFNENLEDLNSDDAKGKQKNEGNPSKPNKGNPNEIAAGSIGSSGSKNNSKNSQNPPNEGSLVPENPEIPAPRKVPQFALLVNDPTCSFCHVRINGDVASTRDVPPIWGGSNLDVNGHWYTATGYYADSATHFQGGIPDDHPLKSKSCMTPEQTGCVVKEHLGANVTIRAGGITQNLGTGDQLPNDLNADGIADFPKLDYALIEKNVRGSLITPGGESIKNIYLGNLVLVGNSETPIQIEGEILVKGDLIIKGQYKGIGNIYATGNIYIPADLKATNSAFPFSEDSEAAYGEAVAAIKHKKDALALATAQSILISDIQSYGPGNRSPFDPAHWAVPTDRNAQILKIEDVYEWYPKAQYDLLYEGNPEGVNCGPHAQNNRTFSIVEAFLYAGDTIGGRANGNSYMINGGIIADHFHIISGAPGCSANLIHPVHGMPANTNYINFDYRMKAGLLLLKQLLPYFEKEI